MKKIRLALMILLGVFIFTGCGNSIDGSWLHYSDYSEKDVIEWDIDSKNNQLTVVEYSDGERDSADTGPIIVDTKQQVITAQTEDHDSYSYKIKNNTLTIDDEIFYRKGSSEDKKAKEEAKRARLED